MALDPNKLRAAGLPQDIVNLILTLQRQVKDAGQLVRPYVDNAITVATRTATAAAEAANQYRQAAQQALSGAVQASQQAQDAAGSITQAAVDADTNADRAETAAASVEATKGRLDEVQVFMQPMILDRGDVPALALINDQIVMALDAQGRLLAEAGSPLISSIFAGATPAQADTLARLSSFVRDLELGETFERGDSGSLVMINDRTILQVLPSGYLDLRLSADAVSDLDARLGIEALRNPPLPALERGDAAEIALFNDTPILNVLPSGRIDLRLSADAVDDVAQMLDLDGLAIATAPLSPDLIGDHDGWDVWQRGGLTYFTGRVWGDYPRGYVKRGVGEAWAVGPSVMVLKLTYGDHLALASAGRVPGHFAHVATLADGAGQEGLNGAAEIGPAVDLARAGDGFAAVAADTELAMKTGARPRYGARSEAVEGASLADLAAGQPMANLIRARDQFVAVSRLYDGDAAVRTLSLLHAGGGTSVTQYRDDLLHLASEVLEKVGPAQLNIVAPSGSWLDGSDPAILGAVEALRARGSMPVALVAPLHWCGIHPGTLATPDAASMTMLAELDAHATLAGTGWHGPIPYRAQRTGTVVHVDFEVMAGFELVAPSYGIHYSGATIQSMAVVPNPLTARNTRLAITLASAAPGILSIAFGRTGTDETRFANRCDLRDTWSAPSVTGATLHRYTHSFQQEVL